LFAPELEWLASLGEEEFRQVFRRIAVKRAKWRGLVRNACVALGNSGSRPGTPGHARIVALLERLAASGEAILAEHARWALARLRSA
jgi:epoxyqueuosine reductase